MENRLIFVTGDAASMEAESLLRGAGVPVILKPYDFGRIEAVIERVGAGDDLAEEAARTSGEQVHVQADQIRRSFLARLRSDPAMPETGHLGDADLEDHTCVLIADLAQALIIPAGSAIEGEAMLRDGTEILRLTSELHGAQRARLGWSDADLAREYAILQEEVLRAIGRGYPKAAAPRQDAVRRTVVAFLSRAEQSSLAALRRERTPRPDEPDGDRSR